MIKLLFIVRYLLFFHTLVSWSRKPCIWKANDAVWTISSLRSPPLTVPRTTRVSPRRAGLLAQLHNSPLRRRPRTCKTRSHGAPDNPNQANFHSLRVFSHILAPVVKPFFRKIAPRHLRASAGAGAAL